MRNGVRVALATVGLSSTVGQIVLMRELVAVFYGNELVFGLILAVWMVWVAVGSWGLGRMAVRQGWDARAFAGMAALTAGLLPVQIALTRSARAWLGVMPGAFAGFGQMVWAILLILAPLCILLGTQFTLGAALLAGDSARQDRSIGAAYAIESGGATLGGAAFSFLLVSVLNPFQIALGLAALNLTMATVVGYRALGRVLRGGLVALAALVLVLAWPLGDILHSETLARQWPGLVLTADTRYGRLVVVRRGEQRIFYENGVLLFETESTFAEEVAHLPLLAHESPSRVLLLGGGVSGVLREILKHPVEEVLYVELDPHMIEVTTQTLSPDEAALLDDPRVRLVYGDGRRLMNHISGTLDVVIVDLPEPSTGQINRFYTREFFVSVRDVLSPGGVLSLGLPSAENYWSPELARRNASVFKTMHDVFPYIVVTPGEHDFYLASTEPVPDRAATLIARMDDRGIETRWVQAPYLEWLFSTDRFAQARARLEAETAPRLNRDLIPICYFYDMALWLTLFGSGLSRVFDTAALIHLWWLLLPLLAGVLILRGKPQVALASAMGLVGFAMMSLEIVLLLAFQALYGYVYYAVGLVITAFMGGLALGAALANLIGATNTRRALLGVLAGTALFAALLPFLFEARLPVAHLGYAVLALVASAMGGLAFALLARLLTGLPGVDTSSIAGLLYGADLVGGCVGAVASGVFLVPVFGISQTCWAVAVIGLAGLLLSTSVSASE